MSDWERIRYVGDLGTAFRKQSLRDAEAVVLAERGGSVEIGVSIMGSGIRHSMDADTAREFAQAILDAADRSESDA